jgi:uncharacterized protein (TIGR00266 family)
MQHSIEHAPTFTTLKFQMEEGDELLAQPGCMLAMSTGFEVKSGMGTHMKGKPGMGGAARSLLAGENFFTAVYRSKRNDQRLILAPGEMGEIRCLEVKPGASHFITSGAFLACTTGVQLKLEYAGVKGWMATRGLFLMKTEGEGLVFVSSYGAVVEQTLAEGERFVLDNRYIVAFASTLTYETVKITDSVRHSIFSGEGLVNRFTGPGSLLYQTRARPKRGFLVGLFNAAT